MFFAILVIVITIIFFIRYYQRHSYLNFEQFKQYYCSLSTSTTDNDESFSLSTTDMFDKCETNNKYHIKSDSDFFSIHKYIQEFLCQNNEYINRAGPVCPFVPSSLKQQSMYFFITNDQHNNKERLIKVIKQCRHDFLYKLKPTDGSIGKLVHKCLVIVIRSSNISHSLIDEIQTELKPDFVVQYGLMLGEFHQSCNSNSLRNENFYPLRTRVPLLVIRYMVANDIVFLDQKHKYPVSTRKNMIEKYRNLYHAGLLYRSKINHLQSADQILEELNTVDNE